MAARTLKYQVQAWVNRLGACSCTPAVDDEAASRNRCGDEAEHRRALAAAKAAFMRATGSNYGYNGRIDGWHPKEVGCRLPPGHHYLDYTGSGVYCQSQLQAAFDELRGNMFGNPHSINPSSAASERLVEEARHMVLSFFNADPAEYTVVFTKGATGALQLVGETFEWSEGSTFAYLDINHNSVLGIRSCAMEGGGQLKAMDEAHVEAWLASEARARRSERAPQNLVGDKHAACSLFAYPGEDNWAGVKYPLSWIEQVHAMGSSEHEWMVLLDAAAYVPTQKLDLQQVRPDFVSMSFYKIFGYPTGLGALVVHTKAAERLQKVYWGGGTVAAATSTANFCILKQHQSARFEDGTINFLDIIGLRHGFALLARMGGIRAVQQHVQCLTEWLYKELSSLKHSNGSPLVRVFGKHGAPNSAEVQGGIITFVVLRRDGLAISHKTVDRQAAAAGFHLRTGTHCNPGATCRFLGIQEREVVALASKLPVLKVGACSELESIRVLRSASAISSLPAICRVLPCGASSDGPDGNLGAGAAADSGMCWVEVPVGAVRVSLGYMSVFEDCYAFAHWMKHQYACKEYPEPENALQKHVGGSSCQ